MKNKPRLFFKFLYTITYVLLTYTASGQSPENWIEKGDTLYTENQYVQALAAYQESFEQQTYTPAMLLKMAYICEGLELIGQSLFYLNLYYLSSKDEAVLVKMKELASKHQLTGYNVDFKTLSRHKLYMYSNIITGLLSALLIIMFLMLSLQKVRRKKKTYAWGIAIVLLFSILFLHINYSNRLQIGIIGDSSTYIMSGPSAASTTLDIVGEGHRVHIYGKKDIWIEIEWKNKRGYVKNNQVLTVKL